MNAKQHRKHLAKTTARRKNVRATAILNELPVAAPERAKTREKLRERYELGVTKTPSRARKNAPAKIAKKLRSQRPAPFKGDAPAKLATTRKKPNAAKLKRERLALGETRAQADRRR